MTWHIARSRPLSTPGSAKIKRLRANTQVDSTQCACQISSERTAEAAARSSIRQGRLKDVACVHAPREGNWPLLMPCAVRRVQGGKCYVRTTGSSPNEPHGLSSLRDTRSRTWRRTSCRWRAEAPPPFLAEAGFGPGAVGLKMRVRLALLQLRERKHARITCYINNPAFNSSDGTAGCDQHQRLRWVGNHTSDASVRCTGHLLAISMSLAR